MKAETLRAAANRVAHKIMATHTVVVNEKVEFCLMPEDMMDEAQLTALIADELTGFFAAMKVLE